MAMNKCKSGSRNSSTFLKEEAIAEVLTKKGLEKEEDDASGVVGAITTDRGMPRTLKDVGVGTEKLDALAENCLKDAWLEINHVPLVKRW